MNEIIDVTLFLKELSELTMKHKLIVGGCGCCGSPFIKDFNGNYHGDFLFFDKEKQSYKIDLLEEKGL